MKNKIKTIICFLMIAIVTIIIIPVIINIAYKQNVTINIFKPEWDASASLTYYGSLAAAGIAIIGVFLTIRYSQNNYKEDTRNRIQPFIIVERLSKQIDKTLYDPEYLTVEETKNDGYKEYALHEFSFILEKGNIIYSSLSIKQNRMMMNGEVMLQHDTTGEHLKKYNYIGIPLKIENVGNGPAINLRFGLDRAEVQEDRRKYRFLTALKKDETIMLHIFSEDCSESSQNLGDYILYFYYEDIYGNLYVNEFPIKIYWNKNLKSPKDDLYSCSQEYRMKKS